MAPKCKAADQLGTVRQVNGRVNVWRVDVKLDRVSLGGPTRTSREEADEDLRAMRALPRSEMASFVTTTHAEALPPPP